MAPFEPKIDSKEFEIANPGHGTAESRGTAAGSKRADLTIRLWRQDAGGNAPGLAWNTESVLVYMIADLVAASQGRVATDLPSAMAARFESSSQALVAAKRIQTAILEFLSCRPGDYAGAAVLIHPPATEGFSPGMAQSALRLAEPGQIILSEELCRRFQDLPGIELRSVPALTTGGTEHAGLAELVWTSAERLARLRSSANAALPTANVGPPVGATMIVNAPLAPRANAPAQPAQQPLGASSDKMDGGAGKSQAPVVGAFKSQDAAFEGDLAAFEEHSSFITKSRVVVGLIAVVLVAVGIALFYPRPHSRVTPRIQETQTGETPSSTSGTPEASHPQPTSGTPEASHPQPPPVAPAVTEPQVKPKPVVAKPAVVPTKPPVDKAKKPVEDTPIVGFEGTDTYDGMTQANIPQLLEWARSDAGNGRYEKAGQEYRVILKLQPNNPAAKEGLRKLQLAQGHDQ